MAILFKLISTIQSTLFPALERELAAPLGEKGELFVTVVELARPESFIERFEWQGVGRRRSLRLSIMLAFIAKAVWNFPLTRALLDRLRHDAVLRRLCGWDRLADLPSESTFSRAFAEFAQSELAQQIHAALVRGELGEKLVGHVSRDSTAIAGREKPARKPPKPVPPKRAVGRPKGSKEDPARPRRRLELQGGRSLEENLADLPRRCDVGAKRNSKGHTEHWIGYKLHLDVADADIPLSAILTSASLHDSQAAIPLAQMTARRVRSLYDLSDSAYDAAEIAGYSRRLHHVPITQPAARGGHKPAPLAPAQAERFKQRTAAERVNSDLLENHGGSTVRVRGAAKVLGHLMWGLLVVTVKGLCRLLE